ncbi:MAG: GGDEF domain-containing protein [Gammaproteobacteria bacterium]|nr:GGDEF domain-containing protein [Gammaproteobacteria bacterium]
MADSFQQTKKMLNELWSLTQFQRVELSDYADTLVLNDIRKGIIILCWVLFLLLACSSALYTILGYERIYVYSSAILALLSLHMSVSVRVINKTKELYLLATTMLVIHGVAMVLLAHQSGGFNAALFASVILLFLVMPLVPWGVREALVIVILVYGIFTFSTLSVSGRFDVETLWILQFVILGASLTTMVVIARNVIIRRNDIKMRYELEQAHDRMEMLSLKDPLTGAWNRRWLDQNFNKIVSQYLEEKLPIYFAIIDINDFKPINDNYGHDYGDLVLKKLSKHFFQAFAGNEHLIRMGGDEFAVLMATEEPKKLLQTTAEELRTDPELFSASRETQTHLSIGVIRLNKEMTVNLDMVYRKADELMYKAKRNKEKSRLKSNIIITEMD